MPFFPAFRYIFCRCASLFEILFHNVCRSCTLSSSGVWCVLWWYWITIAHRPKFDCSHTAALKRKVDPIDINNTSKLDTTNLNLQFSLHFSPFAHNSILSLVLSRAVFSIWVVVFTSNIYGFRQWFHDLNKFSSCHCHQPSVQWVLSCYTYRQNFSPLWLHLKKIC